MAFQAGFNRGDNSEYYALPTSGTGNIMYLEEYGNTGIPGEWMFELGEQRVARCKQGIKGDTCDEGGTIVVRGPKRNKQGYTIVPSYPEQNVLLVNGGQTARCAATVEKAPAIRSPVNVRRVVLNAGPEEIVSQRKRTVMHVLQLNVLQTLSPLPTTIDVASPYRDVNVYPASLAMDTKAAMVLWQLKTPMKLFGDIYEQITVTTSGLLSLMDVPKSVGDKLEELHVTGVAPFFAPIDTSRGGHVTVAEVTDSDTLTRVTRSIQESFEEPSFQARSVLIVTYMNVTDGKSQKGNTFQTLLINGKNSKRETMTFAQMLYKEMQWSGGAEVR
uniref:Nucleoporin_N domain-containing protein n=1 Tax=Angiostrongylus cantonensis TaxID=6313 RepID=A0A158PBH6_ANGCA